MLKRLDKVRPPATVPTAAIVAAAIAYAVARQECTRLKKGSADAGRKFDELFARENELITAVQDFEESNEQPTN